MRKLLIVVLIFILFGCSGKYDGLMVRDGSGNIYKIEHRFAEVYFVLPVNVEAKNSFADVNKRLLEENKTK